MFTVRFPILEIREWAGQYPAQDDAKVEDIIAPAARDQGYLIKEDFVAICRWKTPRSQRRVANNPSYYIEEVTHTALSTPNERLRIEVLTLLRGISWPSTSVILHFCHSEPYPILDFRALWTLSIDQPPMYNFNFWWTYTRFCRELAKQADVSMRVLHRALWVYSKEKQI